MKFGYIANVGWCHGSSVSYVNLIQMLAAPPYGILVNHCDLSIVCVHDEDDHL